MEKTQTLSPDYILRCVINDEKNKNNIVQLNTKIKNMQHELDECKYKNEMLITDLQLMENKYYDLFGKQ